MQNQYNQTINKVIYEQTNNYGQTNNYAEFFVSDKHAPHILIYYISKN